MQWMNAKHGTVCASGNFSAVALLSDAEADTLLMATTIGTPAAFAWLMASSV